MKTRINNLLLVPLLMAALSLAMAGLATAQTFTTLHSFAGSDGANPSAGLVLSDIALYGTTELGGSSSAGTVFKVNTAGTGFTNLYSFTALNNYANSNGANPIAGLILSGNTLYGTAYGGGSSRNGTVFAVNTDGTSFTNLHTFTATTSPNYTNSDGANPRGGLILSGNTLYGTAFDGGSSGAGTVFAVNTDGAGFTNLHNFTALNNLTNSDGYGVQAGLILSGDTLYGTTYRGGSSGNGTVFKVNTDGTAFMNLHNFTARSGFNLTNSDGGFPYAGLILSGNVLYGTARHGGSAGFGTVFAVTTDGSSFTNLHSFTGSDGGSPYAGLILSVNTLYGAATGGGSSGKGTVFAVNTDGTGFTNLHNFTGDDGANPYAGLILSGNILYGTTAGGGSSGNGTVFSLSLPLPPPQLTIIRSGANVVLTWPTNFAGFDYTGFTLQSTTNFVSPVWAGVSPAPVVVNGHNTVTNPASGTQTFYRLSQ